MSLFNLKNGFLAVAAAAFVFAAGPLFAQKAPAKKTLRAKQNIDAPYIVFSKMTGSFDMLKNNKLIQTIEENDFLPENIDANISFEITEGSLEFKVEDTSVLALDHAVFSVDGSKNNVRINNRRISVPLQLTLSNHDVAVLPAGASVAISNQNASVLRGKMYVISKGVVTLLEKGAKIDFISPAVQDDIADADAP